MTIEQIKEMVNGSAYDFLRTNEHLGRKIIFLTLGGSYSYGTNVETSDVDVRGCALNSESDLLGLTSFEQVVNTQTDTTIYAFNKLVSLLLNCNPNTIEMLGGRWSFLAEPKYPKGERVWVGYYNAEHELCFILTSKESREFYFLYELVDGEFKKLGKARTPKELEDKFEVSKRMRCAQ